MKSNAGVYVHIPYCLSKCSYCDFVSSRIDNTFEEYINLLEQEIYLWKSKSSINVDVDTIFFGGGTPSLLSPVQLDRILSRIVKTFAITNNCEISIESNPDTLNIEKLKDYKKIGINRISIGVQTLDDSILKEMNRRHSATQAIRSVLDAYNAGFTNINCDFILGLPSETRATIDNNIKAISELPITHVSTYFLTLSPNVPLSKRLQNNDIMLPTENSTIINWETMVNKLKDMGFTHYEISNYAKKNMECRHNLHYWNLDQWFGIGIASTGNLLTEDKNLKTLKRYTNFKKFSEYKESVKNGLLPEETFELVNGVKKVNEECMLGLRLINEGIPYSFVKNEYKVEHLLENGYIKFINDSIENNYEKHAQEKRIGLTEKGVLVSNQVISSLFID
ncbi:MAG: radical SAM family heme chaperone HemW [Caldisericia bacterium]|nr:radical SAM family heme chaperone HemW [Caldisericia bacterium]